MSHPWKREYTEQLKRIVGDASVLTERNELLNYENDGLGFDR